MLTAEIFVEKVKANLTGEQLTQLDQILTLEKPGGGGGGVFSM